MPANTKTDAYAKRRSATERKLREALERLIKGLPTHPDLKAGRYRVTVATLAKEARIARSAIYANHQSLLADIEAATTADTHIIASWPDKVSEQRAVIARMKADARRLLTENAALLKRALDAEAEAQGLRRRNARLVADRDGGPQPFAFAAQRVMKGVSGG